MVELELPPHAPETATLVLCGRSHFSPVTRRLDVLMPMCCLWLEAKYLPEAHADELSRRTFSTLALGNLVLSHNFPPHRRVYCLLHPAAKLNIGVQQDSQDMDCDPWKRKDELFFPMPFAVSMVQQRPWLPWLWSFSSLKVSFLHIYLLSSLENLGIWKAGEITTSEEPQTKQCRRGASRQPVNSWGSECKLVQAYSPFQHKTGEKEHRCKSEKAFCSFVYFLKHLL